MLAMYTVNLCGALTSLQKSDTSGKVNEAVERCAKLRHVLLYAPKDLKPQLKLCKV
ncbi:unnamed protein product [Arabidopsis halleri]